MTEDVPQQNAAPQASFDGPKHGRRRNRCSSGQTLPRSRFDWIGSLVEEMLRGLDQSDSPDRGTAAWSATETGGAAEVGIEDGR